MTPDRWNLALDAGEFDLPHGATIVLRAKAEADYSILSDVTCVTAFAPDAARLKARGLTVEVEAEGPFSVALVHNVKARAATLSSLAEALGMLSPGGLLLLDGQKDEGVEAVIKHVRRHLDVDGVMSKAHGKLAWLHRPNDIPEAVAGWIAAPQETESGYLTMPGGFSADGPDRGSELLVALAPELKGQVADFGAGWGYIAGEVLAEQDGIQALDLIEADYDMLSVAQLNIDDPRARFHWADVTQFVPDAAYDAVLCNPPFHIGRHSDPDLGRAFIKAAAKSLKPTGRFFMVANRQLPYEDTLKETFGTGRLLGELEGYKIYETAKPKRR